MAENKARVVWSPEAEADLLDIWAYLAREASLRVADEQLRLIDRLCEVLSEWPQSGRPRDEVLPGMRSVPAASYVLFYRASTAVEIVRVLHGRRDIDAIFSLDADG